MIAFVVDDAAQQDLGVGERRSIARGARPGPLAARPVAFGRLSTRRSILSCLVLLGGACSSCHDVQPTRASKQFRIPGPSIERLAPGRGSCIASDRIFVDGCKVGWMVRTEPDGDIDSGWQFFAGDESQEYCDEPGHFGVYDVNTVCNYDRSILPLLDTQPPVAIVRDRVTGQFVRSQDMPSR